MTIKQTLASSLIALAASNTFAAGSPGMEHNTQAFLEALEAGGGKAAGNPQPARCPRRAGRRPGFGQG